MEPHWHEGDLLRLAEADRLEAQLQRLTDEFGFYEVARSLNAFDQQEEPEDHARWLLVFPFGLICLLAWRLIAG